MSLFCRVAQRCAFFDTRVKSAPLRGETSIGVITLSSLMPQLDLTVRFHHDRKKAPAFEPGQFRNG